MAAIAGKNPETYLDARVLVADSNFVRIEPVKSVRLKAPEHVSVQPGPGLAYANQQGVLLLSLTDSPPPDGFNPVGQALVDLNNVEKWRNSKVPIKVTGAGGLKS